jgi:hemerythrin-like metal-binding protein
MVQIEDDMKLIEWDDSFRVGIDDIDNQHKALVQLVNMIISQYHKKISPSNLVSLLEQFIQQFLYHAVYEENYLRNEGFAISPEHKKEHENTIMELKHLQEQILNESITFTEKLMDYFIQLIQTHLSDIDQRDFKRLKK